MQQIQSSSTTASSGGAATGVPSGDNINLTLLRQHYYKQFVKFFEEKPGTKSVFFDESLLKVLSFVIGINGFPDSCKVKQKITLYDEQKDRYFPNVENTTVVFIVRPEYNVINQLIYQRQHWKKDDKDVYILFVPRRTIECDELLHKNKMFQEDKISQINMDLVPLEEDILSLELPNNFRHHMLQDDDTYKVYVQYSIHRLESVFGKIENKFALGKTSKTIVTRIEQNTLNIDQSSNQGQGSQEPEIDALIMMDRDVDLVSPFCINQNYEGLLDEFFTIRSCSLNVNNKIVYPDEKVRKDLGLKDHDSTEFVLDSNDAVFNEIRYDHFNKAGPHLNKQLVDIQRIMEDKNQKNIQELDKFIKKLKNMNIVKAKEIATNHINVSYSIAQQQRDTDYLQVYKLEGQCVMASDKEDLKLISQILETKMVKQYNKMKVLRAMVLFSMTQGGLQKEAFDNLRRIFIMNYGYQEIITLMNLQDAGLFKVKDKKAPGYFDWSWDKIKTALDLINFDVNPMSPSDFAYVFNGFSPISVKLLDLMFQNNGLAPMIARGMLKLIGLTEDKLKVPHTENKFFTGGGRSAIGFKKKRVLVYFIGGITQAEIAAIKFLQKMQPMFKFIIATTCIINGETALSQLLGPQFIPESEVKGTAQGLILEEVLKGY